MISTVGAITTATILLVLHSTAGIAAAQDAAQPLAAGLSGAAFGIQGGFNVASLVENTEKLDSKTGLVGGAFLRMKVNDAFSLQPEVLLSQQGAAFRSASLRVTYLQIPVLGVATFQRATATPFLFAGPAIGLKVSSSVTVDGEKLDADLSAGDFSFVLGAGVDVHRFSLNARYIIGLKDIDPGRDIDKNRVFSILVGYRIR